MIRIAALLLTLCALASCGADGAPTAPGVAISGTAQMGVAKDGG
jgi:hypothetical protein